MLDNNLAAQFNDIVQCQFLYQEIIEVKKTFHACVFLENRIAFVEESRKRGERGEGGGGLWPLGRPPPAPPLHSQTANSGAC
jgi:hypothetical protein